MWEVASNWNTAQYAGLWPLCPSGALWCLQCLSPNQGRFAFGPGLPPQGGALPAAPVTAELPAPLPLRPVCTSLQRWFLHWGPLLLLGEDFPRVGQMGRGRWGASPVPPMPSLPSSPFRSLPHQDKPSLPHIVWLPDFWTINKCSIFQNLPPASCTTFPSSYGACNSVPILQSL